MSILKEEGEDILSKADDGYNSAFLGADLELDGTINNTPRRREISLYRDDELVLNIEHGVTLGFLKLCYSSDPKLTGVLQGVRSRCTSSQSQVSSIQLSDERVLDQNEYELIVLEQVPSHQSHHKDMLPQSLSPRLPSLEGATLSTVTTLPTSATMPPTAAMSPPSITVPPTQSSAINANNGDKKLGSFVCEYCHLPFISKAKFLRHRRIHTEENPYMCIYCHETFSHHSDLRKHRNELHMTNKSFKCNFCPKTFGTRAELKGHLWRHTGEKCHKCNICGKSFATKGNLKLHIDKHVGVHRHKCPFCPQRFTSHSSLEAHMAKHTGMRAYKCRYCPKSYAQAGQLTSHERLHTGEKPFVCQVCGNAFRLNSTRLAHEKRHSGARPHICDTCGRSFAMPDHLRRHLKTHENKLDRLVACPFCKKRIFSGRNMRKHLIRHRDLNLTESQAKAISASLKPDREVNEREMLGEDQRSNALSRNTRQIIQCVECDEELKSVRKLFEHLATAHYQRELTAVERKEMRLRHGLQKLHHCLYCSAFFIDYRLLRSHVLSEHADRAEESGFFEKNSTEIRGNDVAHKCPNCSLGFQLRGALEQHIIKDHLTSVVENSTSTKEELCQFRCWYCVASFQSPEEVVSHMTNAHETLDVLSKRVEMTEATGENDVTTSGVWSCPQCPLNLKSHEKYLEHLSIHVTPDIQASKDKDSEGKGGRAAVVVDDTNKYLNPIKGSSNSSTKSTGSAREAMEMEVDEYLTTATPTAHIPNKGTSSSSAKTEMNSNTITTDGNSNTAVETTTAATATTTTNEEAHSISTQTPSVPVMGASPTSAEVYLTTSSLSAKRSDLHRATPDLSRVDFVRFASMEDGKAPFDPSDIQNSGFGISIPASEFTDHHHHILTLSTNIASKKFSNKKSRKKKKLKYSGINNMSKNYNSNQQQQRQPQQQQKQQQQQKSSSSKNNNNTSPSLMESCQYCSDVFKNKEELTSHLQESHSNNNEEENLSPTITVVTESIVPFRCWFCSANFNNPEEVVSHMTNEHDNLDNLSRRIEMTDLRPDNIMIVEKSTVVSKLKHLKMSRESDASLSPAVGMACPNCPKKLGSKEAYELHMMVHNALASINEHPPETFKTNELINRQHSVDRPASVAVHDVTLTGETDQVHIDEDNGSNFNNYNNYSAATTTITSKSSSTQSKALSSSATTNILQQQLHVPRNRPTGCLQPTSSKRRSKKSAVSTKTFQTQQHKSNKRKSKILPFSVPANSQSITTNPPTATTKTMVTIVDGSNNVSVNMCPHCSRVFCGRKALNVHTLKMHGKEYLQKRLPQSKTSPFTCWFCSANFKSPEQVVEHMTCAHENLDKLSKRVESQELPQVPSAGSPSRGKIIKQRKTVNEITVQKFIPIAPHKKAIPKQPPSQHFAPVVGPQQTQQTDNHRQPPPGFKMSYALAYVPVFVPDRNEDDEDEEKK